MLQGRTAIITGSTSGIGRAMATALARAGCNVVVNGFADPDAVLQLKEELLRHSGTGVLYHPADLSRASECGSLIQAAKEHFGTLDILVNNAGMQHIAPLEEFPPDRWDAILNLNLSAAFHTMRAALPLMRQRGWGRIINIASVHGLVASVHKSAYVASKHGLIGLTKVVALETAAENITCNAICPGFVLTSMIEEQIETRANRKGQGREEAERDLLEEKQPSLRFTTVDQIAALAVFLCSEEAANITGASLPVDGGWTAQ